MKSLVQPLFDGPLDIVGDVHGEIDVLHALLAHLGYDSSGGHPVGRRLVFLGDLTDRGPDSPAVVDLVASLVRSGRAQCVLGNHDLNLMLAHIKHENVWFYGREFKDKDGQIVPQRLANDTIRTSVLAFFHSLPLALERPDLRVVHAYWDARMIEIARNATNVLGLYEQYRRIIEIEMVNQADLDDVGRNLLHQNTNPVKLLSSGPEERAPAPVESNGKLRGERRVEWWPDFPAGSLCVFGHYSIPADPPPGEKPKPRGNHSSFCVDFGVGKRWTERKRGLTEGFACRLAALRYPERIVVFDNNEERAMD